MWKLAASCALPPPGLENECIDTVGGPGQLLRPFGVVVLAVVIVCAVVVGARRGEYPTRRFVPLAALIAASAIVFAAWAGTHDFFLRGANCSAVGRGVGAIAGREWPPQDPDCLRFARTVFGFAAAGAAGALVVLWFVARERIPVGSPHFVHERPSTRGA